MFPTFDTFHCHPICDWVPSTQGQKVTHNTYLRDRQHCLHYFDWSSASFACSSHSQLSLPVSLHILINCVSTAQHYALVWWWLDLWLWVKVVSTPPPPPLHKKGTCPHLHPVNCISIGFIFESIIKIVLITSHIWRINCHDVSLLLIFLYY